MNLSPVAVILNCSLITMFDWSCPELAGKHPEKWQREVLRAIRDGLPLGKAIRIAVATGHGVGKTALVAWIILWSISTMQGLPRNIDREQRSPIIHEKSCGASEMVSALSWSRVLRTHSDCAD